MTRQPQLIPSLGMLLAFEAVIRHGSVTGAAGELHLTQSTVSRLVQGLEAQLGRTLFVRSKQRLVATSAALAYQREVTRGLDLVQHAGLALIANPGGGSLALAVLPTFGTRWLAPRLERFFDEHPGISLNLSTRIGRFDLAADVFDAVIFYGEPDWPGALHAKLFDEHLTACATKAFLAKHRVKRPRDLARLPLLQLETRLGAWDDWFRAQGETPPPVSGMLLDQFAMMIQAAISGLGVALLPDYLAAMEIAEGRLVPVARPAVRGTGAYWLAWPESRNDWPPLVAFRAWLELSPR